MRTGTAFRLGVTGRQWAARHNSLNIRACSVPSRLRPYPESRNEELADALLGWFSGVWVWTRLRDVEVEPVASFKEVPKMLDENFDSWADAWIAKGETKGRKDLLLRQVRVRYGDSTATAIAPALDAVRSLPTLDDIGVWIVTCGTADALLARIRAL